MGKVYYTVTELVEMGFPRSQIDQACRSQASGTFLVQPGKHKKRVIHLEKFKKYNERLRGR